MLKTYQFMLKMGLFFFWQKRIFVTSKNTLRISIIFNSQTVYYTPLNVYTLTG